MCTSTRPVVGLGATVKPDKNASSTGWLRTRRTRRTSRCHLPPRCGNCRPDAPRLCLRDPTRRSTFGWPAWGCCRPSGSSSSRSNQERKATSRTTPRRSACPKSGGFHQRWASLKTPFRHAVVRLRRRPRHAPVRPNGVGVALDSELLKLLILSGRRTGDGCPPSLPLKPGVPPAKNGFHESGMLSSTSTNTKSLPLMLPLPAMSLLSQVNHPRALGQTWTTSRHTRHLEYLKRT